jgi:hypothetical protein
MTESHDPTPYVGAGLVLPEVPRRFGVRDLLWLTGFVAIVAGWVGGCAMDGGGW